MFCKNCEEYVVEGDYSHSEAHFSLSLHTWMNNEHFKTTMKKLILPVSEGAPRPTAWWPAPRAPPSAWRPPPSASTSSPSPPRPPWRRPRHRLFRTRQYNCCHTFIWNKYKSCSAMSALLRLGLLARRVIYWRNSTTNITFCQMTPWRLQKQGSTKM